MILGLSVADFVLVHVAISLIAIVSGIVAMRQILRRRKLGVWNGLFLAATILTSATGFMFPFRGIGPGHVTGALSLVALAVALAALYWRQLAGPWRLVYAGAAAIALYLNVFILVLQAFSKLAFLHALMQGGAITPLAAAQLAVLTLFVGLAVNAVRRLRPH